MTHPYSDDLRERAVARAAAGEPIRAIAAALQIGPSCIPKWSRRVRETGAVSPGQIRGHKPRTLSGAIAEWLRARMAEQPFTLRGLVRELAERGVKADYHSVWDFVHDEGLSFKKTVFAGEQARADVARRRRLWKARQSRIDPARLVFIDETWIKTNMAPLRGWSPRGQRLRAFVPFGHWKTLTFIAALRCDRIEAPCVFDGPINGEMFRHYVTDVLLPTLVPGDIVVLDNLGSHKGEAVKQAVRDAAERVVEATWRRVGTLLDAFPPSECANYFTNSGYGSA